MEVPCSDAAKLLKYVNGIINRSKKNKAIPVTGLGGL
jgi:hypothetical protein